MVIRLIDDGTLHTDPIKTHELLNSLIDASQKGRRRLFSDQSGTVSCRQQL